MLNWFAFGHLCKRLFAEIAKRFIQRHALAHRLAWTPVIVQSAVPTAPDLCKNVSLAALFGSNVNTYTAILMFPIPLCTNYTKYNKKKLPVKRLYIKI
jgi:hypothetical protein